MKLLKLIWKTHPFNSIENAFFAHQYKHFQNIHPLLLNLIMNTMHARVKVNAPDATNT